MIDIIKSLSHNFLEEIIEIRRHLHQYPELSFKEEKTSLYIKSILKKWNIPFIDNIAGNGIMVILRAKNPDSHIIALRADIDALPIHEESNISYCSKNKGVMHACGHDAHTASLLGAIKILSSIKEHWKGTIKFIFQPAEEMLPGGAKQMIEEGVLVKPTVKRMLAQHVFPELEYGKVGFRKGKYMASTDELHVDICGKGGHAALPDKYNNPIIAASQLIVNLNQHFKNLNNNYIVCAIGFVEALGSTNIIPNHVYLKGTLRVIDESSRLKAHKDILAISNDISKQYSLKVDFDIRKGFPCLINDHQLTSDSVKYAIQYLGNDNVVELPIRMTAEDFAYYSQLVPSCFYRLGTGNKQQGITHALHTSQFNIDERSLEIGMGLMAYLAINV